MYDGGGDNFLRLENRNNKNWTIFLLLFIKFGISRNLESIDYNLTYSQCIKESISRSAKLKIDLSNFIKCLFIIRHTVMKVLVDTIFPLFMKTSDFILHKWGLGWKQMVYCLKTSIPSLHWYILGGA